MKRIILLFICIVAIALNTKSQDVIYKAIGADLGTSRYAIEHSHSGSILIQQNASESIYRSSTSDYSYTFKYIFKKDKLYSIWLEIKSFNQPAINTFNYMTEEMAPYGVPLNYSYNFGAVQSRISIDNNWESIMYQYIVVYNNKKLNIAIIWKESNNTAYYIIEK